MNKYKSKLPREDLKKFAKEISKKLVESDYKHNRVGDPTKINEKIERGVKKFAKEFFDKCVKRHAEHEKKKADKRAQAAKTNGEASHTPPGEPEPVKEDDDEDIKLELDEDMGDLDDADEEATPSDLKRKRELDALMTGDAGLKDEDSPSSPKKLKSAEPPPPPPPPPPPAEGMDLDNGDHVDDATIEQSAIEDSFTQEAQDAVNGASPAFAAKLENGESQSQPSPKQLATPSTNGSYPYDASKKVDGSNLTSVRGEVEMDKI